MSQYWNQSMETMSRDELHALQGERLHALVKHVYENVPFYYKKMQALGVTPDDIKTAEDVRYLPFTTKQDLRDHYPFGLFAVPQSEIVRVHASSGTTGKPTVAGYTQGDLNNWAELIARGLTGAEVQRGSVVHVAYGYGLFTGGLGVHYGAEKIGASVVPVSGGNTKRQLMLLKDFRATTLCCTPSYALTLADAYLSQGGDIGELSLKTGVFGAEPWTDEMRAQLEEKLHIKAFDIYGLTEMMGPGVAIECEERHGLHIWEDHFLPEIIDEDGNQLPNGEEGELVFTTLTKRGMPLLRYRTHDISCLTTAPCPCGRTHIRMRRVHARSDDMLIIRGVNVFPSQIEHTLLRFEGVTPHYMIVVDRQGTLDTIEVQVELSKNLVGDTVREVERLRAQLEAALASDVLVHISVKLCQPGSLPRFEGKAKRVIDHRTL